MNAEQVRARLAGRWPDDRWLHVYEAPLDSSRQGSKIDVLVMALWQSDRHELDAIEVKVSYQDWLKEWRRVSWALTTHDGRQIVSDRQFTPWQLAYHTRPASPDDAQPLGRTVRDPVPVGFVPNVERMVAVNTTKNEPWRRHSHRFWIAAPEPVAQRIFTDVQEQDALRSWGVLAVTDRDTRVLWKPTVNKTPKPLAPRQYLGIIRAAADSGLKAIERARNAGWADGHKAGKAAAQLLEPPPPPPPPPPPSTDVADTSAHHTRRPDRRTLKWPPT